MAAPVRFKAEFRSELNVLYEVNIHDEDWTGSVIPFNIGGEGFNLHYASQNQKRWNPIVASECNFSFLIENADHEAFITDIVTAAEGRFTIRIKQGSVLNYWVGFVLLDIAMLEDAPFPYFFEVSAVDGLGMLKNDLFSEDEDTEYTGWDSFVSIIFKCLRAASPLMQHFDSSDHYLITAAAWKEARHGTIAANKDPLALTRVQHVIFFDTDKKGVKTFKSSYEILKMVLEAWCMRIIWSRGSYYVEQINARHESSYMTRSYSKAGTLVGSSAAVTNAVDVHQYDNSKFRMAGGTYTWWPILLEAANEYEHFTWENLLKHHPHKWDSKLFNDIDPAVELLDVGLADTHSLNIGGSLYAKATILKNALVPAGSVAGTLLVYSRLVFKLTVTANVGGTLYYLKRTSFSALNTPLVVEYSPLTWETTASFVEVSTEYSNLIDFETNLGIDLWTPILPGAADSLTFEFKFFEIRDMTTGISFLPNTVQPGSGLLAFTDTYIFVYEAGLPAESEDTLLFSRKNSIFNTGEKYKLTLPFGDGPKAWSRGRLQTYDGSAWADSTEEWSLLSFVGRFDMLLLNEVMRGSELPVKRVKGRVFGSSIYAVSKLNAWTGTDWLLLGGTFTANRDEWAGEWFEINSLATPSGGTTTTGTTKGTPFPGKKGPGLTGGLPPGMVGIPGGQPSAINPTGVSSLSIFSNGKTGLDLAAGTITSIPVADELLQDAFNDGDIIYLVNPLTGSYDQLTVTASVVAGDMTISVDGDLTGNYPLNATIIKDPSHGVKQSNVAVPFQTLRHYFSTTSPSLAFPVVGGRLVFKIVIVSTSNCTVKVGDDALRLDNIMKAKFCAANVPMIFDGGFFFENAGFVYVSGMAGTTKFYIWFI